MSTTLIRKTLTPNSWNSSPNSSNPIMLNHKKFNPRHSNPGKFNRGHSNPGKFDPNRFLDDVCETVLNPALPPCVSRYWERALLLYKRGLYYCKKEGSTTVKKRALLLHKRGLYYCIKEGFTTVKKRALLLYKRGLYYCIKEGSTTV